MAGTFGVVSPAGPVANAVVLPLLPVLIVLGGAGAALGAVLPAIGWPLLQLGGLGASVIVLVGRVSTAVPGAFVQVGTWPVAWTVAEVCGLCAAGAVGAFAWSRRDQGSPPPPTVTRPRPRYVRFVLVAAAAGVVGAVTAGYAASRPDRAASTLSRLIRIAEEIRRRKEYKKFSTHMILLQNYKDHLLKEI